MLPHGPSEACLHPLVGPALHGAVGAAWKGKASVSQGAMLAWRCSLGVDGQPSRWTVAEGRTSPVGALTETGNGERDLGGGIMSTCLGSTIHPPQHLPSCGSLCRCNSSFFQPEPLRP